MNNYMDKIMAFVENNLSAKLQGATKNAYISGLQSAVSKTIPMIFVSSIITIYNIIRNFAPFLPNLSAISNYSFGLIGLFMGFLVPFYILEKKENKNKYIGGLTGLALYMMTVNPTVTDAGYVYNFTSFGAGGMFVAIIAGVFVVFVFSCFKKFTVFGEDSAMPDFCKEWFDTLLPIFTVIFAGWFVILNCKIDLYSILVNVFRPILDISSTYIGMLLMLLIPTIFYTMGISGWIFSPIFTPIQNTALAANIEAWAAGQPLPFIYTAGLNPGYLKLGGQGNTLPLNYFFLFSKSKRLRSLGKAFLVPGLLNINEPIIFGTIVWNPILMIPCWITAIVNLTMTYLAMRMGLVLAPHVTMGMWYLPVPIPAILVGGIPGLILCLINLGLDAFIWYPFFKVYEKKVMAEDGELEMGKESRYVSS